MVGVSHRTYQRWERGDAMPYQTNVHRIAEFLGVEPSEIMDPFGTPQSQSQLDRIEAKIDRLLSSTLADPPAAFEQAVDEAVRAKRSRRGGTSGGQASKRKRRATGESGG